jgi:hypothetical protein
MPLKPIATLIDKQDTAEVVRDQIAAILFLETLSQQALAVDAAKDPLDWTLRIFSERANPWEQFTDGQKTGEDATPIVNIAWDSASYDRSKSDPTRKQHAVGIYNIDCYGYGLSKDDGGPGHTAGDKEAAFEVQRAYRLVRNMLMAGVNRYLQLQGVVGNRWPQAINIFQPQQGGTPVENVVGARLVLNVEFNEFSPQVEGEILELVTNQVKRTGDGKIVLNADYEYPL